MDVGEPVLLAVSSPPSGARLAPPLGSVPAAFAVAFSPPANLSNSAPLSQGLALGVDASGVVTVAWEESSTHAGVSRSYDGGRTFESMDGFFEEISVAFPTQIDLAVAPNGTTHVTGTLFLPPAGYGEVLHATAADGSAFSAAAPLSAIDELSSIASSVAAGDGSYVAVAWYDSDQVTGQPSVVRFRRSTDGGGAFDSPLPLSDPDDGSAFCPELAVRSQDTYVLWTQGPFLEEEIYFSKSTDGGATFSAPLDVSQSPGKSWCPRLGVDGAGVLYAIWPEGAAFDRRVLFSRSLDGGASFSSPVVVSTPDTDAGCPALGVGSDGRVYVTWSEGSFSSETFEAKLRTSWNGGSWFGPPQTVPVVGSADGCPEIAVDQANRLHLAWPETPPEATWADVFHSVGTPPPPIRIWRARDFRPQPHDLPVLSRVELLPPRRHPGYAEGGNDRPRGREQGRSAGPRVSGGAFTVR